MRDNLSEMGYVPTHQHPAWKALGNILVTSAALLRGYVGTAPNRLWKLLRKQINTSL